MKQDNIYRRVSRGLLHALVWLGVMTAVACGGDVNFSPTQPSWPNTSEWTGTELGERILEISGDLVAEDGSCLEATVLYDGVEVKGARAVCSESEGCAQMKLAATVQSGAGRHTVSFQVLRQSSEAVKYSAQGTVRVSRENLVDMWSGAPWAVSIPLRLTRAKLNSGESISFEFKFDD